MKLGPGALVWAGFDGAEAPDAFLDAIREGKIGGVLLFAARGNVRSKAQVREMNRTIQDAAARGGLPPVPVAVDQEGGTVVRVGYRAVFPSAMAIAATGDHTYAERAARAVAEGLLCDGITVNHAPVCDVNSEPRNPVIGTRSFGDDPGRVAQFAAAWVRGSETAGVASTPKHFPGHGDAPVDSHFVTVDVTADRDTIERRELVPFRAAFAAGASMVMTAHVRYVAIDPDTPATISSKILTELLRRDLGFDGLCVTDSLDMRGIEVDSPKAVVARAMTSGVDAVMVTSGFDRQEAAAGWITETVSPARIGEALRRATAFRGRFADAPQDRDIDDDRARRLAREIAERSITHVGPQLPRLGGRVRVAIMGPGRASPVEELSDPVGTLTTALRRTFGDRLVVTTDGTAPEGDGPLVVFTFSAAFDQQRADRVRALLRDDGVLCAVRSPYDVTLAPDRPALLSYCDIPVSLEALVDVLSGARAASGTAPVRL